MVHLKALLVIDMLNDFIDKSGSMQCGDAGREIIPFIKDQISCFHKNNDKVFFVCDNHNEDDKEFEHFSKFTTKELNSKVYKGLKIGNYFYWEKKWRQIINIDKTMGIIHCICMASP